MNDDLQCPYCDADNEVCHDDGAGYSEDQRHEMTCHACDKSFTFTTSISFSYYPRKADCLNDGQHRLKFAKSYPARYSSMKCADCDYARKPTPEEFAAAGLPLEATGDNNARD